jgi:hypothetical protein
MRRKYQVEKSYNSTRFIRRTVIVKRLENSYNKIHTYYFVDVRKIMHRKVFDC